MANKSTPSPDPITAAAQAGEAAKFENQAPDNIPRASEAVSVGGTKAPELDEYEGEYKRKSDGELYALALAPDDRLERTHKAQNTVHFWEGTEAEFRAAFTNEDGSPIKEAKETKKKSKK